MYNWFNLLKVFKIGVFTLMFFVGVQDLAIGFNLVDEISSVFQSHFNGGMSDEYMLHFYSQDFSKDPFGDAITSIEDKSMQLKIAGAEYVENSLKEKGCYISQKKIWGILYYFLPEFRVELARTLKQSLGDYDSKKYVFDVDTIEDYCREFFVCQKSEGYSPLKILREEGVKRDDLRGISSSTPAEVMTNCMEFFQENYRKGQYNEEIVQNIKSSEVGADKYRNQTTDDSPYDIMTDLGILAKLLYWEAQEPITPVFYNIPAFSNSKKALNESRDSGGGGGEESRNNSSRTSSRDGGSIGGLALGGDGEQNPTSLVGGVDSSDIGEKGGANRGLTSDVTPIPLSSNINMDKGYDELVEGLDSYGIVGNDTEFYSSLCKDDEVVEPELGNSEDNGKKGSQVETRIIDELSYQEYQELVDYMIEAVDQYTDLPEDTEEETQQNMGNVNDFFDATDSAEIEKVKEKIKNCWKSCEGLRIDQKASCMLKCACGEIKSPIFDPNKVPGLGPIFILRFCAVPAVNTKFSVGGKKIHSVEEGLNEIYGVVDKLAREGRLGKWVPQNEFLDSSTKQMNIADTFAFTIDLEMVDISGNPSKKSDQYKDKSIKTQNDNWKTAYFVSNQLNNPSTKNTHSVIESHSSTGLNMRPEPLADFIRDSGASRHSVFEESVGKWMQQQGALWTLISKYISDLEDYSDTLFYKKCDK